MKKIYRSRMEKVFGGVCGGLGNYLDIDPVLIRVIFVVAALFNGFGLLAYIILWVIIPEEPFVFPGKNPETGTGDEQANTQTPPPPVQTSTDSGRIIAGAFLIGIGLLFFSHKFFYFLHIRDILPIGLIIIGVLILVNAFKR